MAIADQFDLEARGSSVATEFRGGLATFLTMAYILFANPRILAAAGVPLESATACTALAAGLCCILMGFASNLPVAMASGMGLNAVVAYQIAPLAGSWQAAMGLVVFNGLIVLALVLAGVREKVLEAIPHDLRMAIGAGIGLFIAFIGLVNARLVVVPSGTLGVLSADPAAILPPVGPGSIHDPHAATALLTLLVMAVMMARKVKGAILVGIAGGTAIGWAMGIVHAPSSGLVMPSFAAAFQVDLAGAMKWTLLAPLLGLVMVDFFDTLGTASAIAEEAGLADDDGRIPGIRGLLVADSLSASIGGMLGVSSVTSYIESAAGVAEGARTGLHSVFVGLFFLAAVLLAPVAGVVPAAATAPALILVGFLMMTQVARIDFARWETAIPAFLILLVIPLTYSISHGIGYGFIAYVVIQLLSGRAGKVSPIMYAVAAAFVGYLWIA